MHAGGASGAPRPKSGAVVAEKHVVRVARGQRGVITYRQLRAAGLSDRQIAHRVATGWLVRLHEGVYAVGTVGAIGLIQGALFAGGPESMADDESSAALHEFLPYPAAVYIATPRNGARPKGVITRQPRTAPAWILRHGLRTATVPETLLQLAARDPGLALQATDQAFIDRRTDAAALTRFLNSRKGRRGVANLRRIVDGPHTRSQIERIFWRLLEEARLPLPLVNVWVNGHLVDFYWPAHGLIVETDGWGSHGRRAQWERDRRRDLDHFASGIAVLRVTARQLEYEPLAVVVALTRRLEASALRRGTAAS